MIGCFRCFVVLLLANIQNNMERGCTQNKVFDKTPPGSDETRLSQDERKKAISPVLITTMCLYIAKPGELARISVPVLCDSLRCHHLSLLPRFSPHK